MWEVDGLLEIVHDRLIINLDDDDDDDNEEAMDLGAAPL